MPVSYEWAEEIIDINDDIVDHFFSKKLEMGMYLNAHNYKTKYQLALIRYEGTPEEGETHRAYAYMLNNELEEEFDDGRKVPQRFIIELAKMKTRIRNAGK